MEIDAAQCDVSRDHSAQDEKTTDTEKTLETGNVFGSADALFSTAGPDYDVAELVYCRGCFNMRHGSDHPATGRDRLHQQQDVATTTLDAERIVSLLNAKFISTRIKKSLHAP